MSVSTGDKEPMCSRSSFPVSMILTAADIPGATLSKIHTRDANIFPKLTIYDLVFGISIRELSARHS